MSDVGTKSNYGLVVFRTTQAAGGCIGLGALLRMTKQVAAWHIRNPSKRRKSKGNEKQGRIEMGEDPKGRDRCLMQ